MKNIIRLIIFYLNLVNYAKLPKLGEVDPGFKFLGQISLKKMKEYFKIFLNKNFLKYSRKFLQYSRESLNDQEDSHMIQNIAEIYIFF